MMTVHRASERELERWSQREIWFTSYARLQAPPLDGERRSFGGLLEGRLPPSASFPRHRGAGAELLTYVWEGAIVFQDDGGRHGLLRAGEFRHTVSSGGEERNHSSTEWARVFRVSVRASPDQGERPDEQRRFTRAQRRNVACVVASSDGRDGSLSLQADARIYSSVLDPGHHLVHELGPGRRGWLHIVTGEATVNGSILQPGDGADVTEDRALSVTGRRGAEILLVDTRDGTNGAPR